MSPERILGERPIRSMPSDVWAWGCTVFQASGPQPNALEPTNCLDLVALIFPQILTDEQPFKGNGPIIYSILHRRVPGRAELLLDLVPRAPKPEYASTLRLLHSYLPLCWRYEPIKRPRTSALRQQVFMFSFEEEVGDSVVVRFTLFSEIRCQVN